MKYVLEPITLPVVANSCPRGDAWFASHYGSSVPQRAKILRRIETERRGVADRSCASALDLRAMRLSAVFDKRESVAFRDLRERGKVGALTVEVYRQDRRGTRTDCCLHLRDVDCSRHRFGIDKDDLTARVSIPILQSGCSCWQR